MKRAEKCCTTETCSSFLEKTHLSLDFCGHRSTEAPCEEQLGQGGFVLGALAGQQTKPREEHFKM